MSSYSAVHTPGRARTYYRCNRCSRVFLSPMAVIGHQNAHRETPRAAKRRRGSVNHHLGPMVGSATRARSASVALVPFRQGHNGYPLFLQAPSAIGGPRYFEVPALLGPSVDQTDGASSTRPIVIDSDDEAEEENPLDLDLKL